MSNSPGAVAVQTGSASLCYRLSHDGRTFAVGPSDGKIQLVDVDSGTVVHHFLHDGGDINDVCFSPDDSMLSSASDNHTAWLWDIQSGKVLHRLEHDYQVQACKFSPDGKQVVTGSSDFSAQVWDVQTGQPIGERMRHQGEVSNASLSSDGKRILTSARDGTARIWDASTGKPIVPFMVHSSALREANFSPDGRIVVTVDHDALQVWDAASGQPQNS